MDMEFHYYITGIIARAAGFNERQARAIAYSSQFVDDNDVVLTVKNRDGQSAYTNYISQTLDILKPKRSLMRIYPVFHYAPGDPMADSARRRDGKMHLLNTIPDNEIANQMMRDAFKAPEDVRPYRIGIASHVFADSWAHQNFVGINDNFNCSDLNPMPNVGHADALYHPDWVAHRWVDDRLTDSIVDNTERFLQAGKRLFELYSAHLNSDGDFGTLQAHLLSAIGRSRHGDVNKGLDERLERWAEIADWMPEYEEDAWLDEAAEPSGDLACRTHDEYEWLKHVDPEQTHWWRFQEAVKEHQAAALPEIQKICDKMRYTLT